MADDAKLRGCGADWVANNCADVTLETSAAGGGSLLRLLVKES
jgi:hypothetical protein